MDTKVLNSIGLTEKEIKIYLAILKHGPCLASRIASESGLNRTYVYDRIEKLIEKGIVSYVIRENRKYFNISSASNVMNYIEEQERELAAKKEQALKLIEELEKTRANPEEVIVETFKGTEGMKTLMNHVISVGDTLRIFPYTGSLFEKMPIFYRNYLKRREEAGIKRRFLMTKDKRHLMQEKMPLTEVRYLPKDYDSPASTWTYGDYSVIYIAAEELTLIRVKSKTVSDLYTNFFEKLWKMSSK